MSNENEKDIEVKEPGAKQPKSLDSIISNRILVLASIIVAMFSILGFRLIYLQGFQHEEYVAKQDDYSSIRQYTAAPRGQIYDRNGNVLAKTVVSHNIVYTSPNNMTIRDYLVYADRVVTVFDVPVSEFSDQELRDAYLTYCAFVDPTDAQYQGLHLLSEKELTQYRNGTWGENASRRLYQAQMKALREDPSLINISEQDQKIYAVYNRMMANAASGQESVIIEDVSDTDVAYLVEHKTEFPGFDVDFGGWKREYPYGESLSDVLGTVSTSTEGLPAEYADYYLSKGYQLNAPVGKSGLEFQYNDLLAGTEEITKITYDSNGLARKEVLQQARKGYDLYLSIDIDLQQTLDNQIKTVLKGAAGTSTREAFDRLYMCMMDPTTGNMLALSGYQIDLETGAMTYFASGNYMDRVHPGSSIKGATVYMGLAEGVIEEGEVINDTVMTIGNEQFASFKNHGLVDEVKALSVSSNVYMFNIAIRLGGDTYEPGRNLNIPDVMGTLDKMRNYYSMFGLGNPTGLDVPGEVGPYIGVNTNPGMLLNYSIGQFDTCTPLQLLSYVSTIAANGKVYEPHFYTYAKEVNGDQIFDVNEPELKNTFPEEDVGHLTRVQEGLRACVAEGNCYVPLQTQRFNMAAKTGTAEVEEWTTANLVGYGPYEAPTMAFACSAPLSSVNSQDVAENICASQVVGPVVQKYFEIFYPE